MGHAYSIRPDQPCDGSCKTLPRVPRVSPPHRRHQERFTVSVVRKCPPVTRGTRFTGNRPLASPSAAEFALRNRTLTKILYETLTEPGGRCLTLKEMDYGNRDCPGHC